MLSQINTSAGRCQNCWDTNKTRGSLVRVRNQPCLVCTSCGMVNTQELTLVDDAQYQPQSDNDRAKFAYGAPIHRGRGTPQASRVFDTGQYSAHVSDNVDVMFASSNEYRQSRAACDAKRFRLIFSAPLLSKYKASVQTRAQVLFQQLRCAETKQGKLMCRINQVDACILACVWLTLRATEYVSVVDLAACVGQRTHHLTRSKSYGTRPKEVWKYIKILQNSVHVKLTPVKLDRSVALAISHICIRFGLSTAKDYCVSISKCYMLSVRNKVHAKYFEPLTIACIAIRALAIVAKYYTQSAHKFASESKRQAYLLMASTLHAKRDEHGENQGSVMDRILRMAQHNMCPCIHICTESSALKSRIVVMRKNHQKRKSLSTKGLNNTCRTSSILADMLVHKSKRIKL